MFSEWFCWNDNKFQQNISIKLADDYLNTFTGSFIKFPVDLKYF